MRLPALAFALLAVPLGVLLALAVPLGQVPDEPNQAMRAYALAHGELVGRRVEADGRAAAVVWTDPAVAAVAAPPMLTRPARVAPVPAVGWTGHRVAVHLGSIAGYFPIFYLPAAAALGVAEALGAPPKQALCAARILNLIAFALIGVLALRLARRGTALLFAVLALPMTLGLAASASQDGLLIASSVLAAALLGRGGGDVASGWYRGGAALLACIVAVKLPYLPLLAMLLLPLERGGLRRRAIAVALACVPALLWAFATADVASVPRDYPPYEAGPLWPGSRPAPFVASDPSAQLRVLLAAPWRLATLPLATLWHDRLAFAAQTIGVFGWLACVLPRWLYAAWGAALAAALLAGLGDAPAPGRAMWEALLLVAATAAAALGALLAIYLSWSHVGAALIEGGQGRYFLPLLPMLGRAIPAIGARRLRWLALAPLTLAAVDLATVPRVVGDWFHPAVAAADLPAHDAAVPQGAAP